jgi:outer membrane protein OmpA-like peptidoglycan-associated protein
MLFIDHPARLVTISILLFLCFQYTGAQNLIPDSSFENNKYIPIEFSAIHSSNSWSAPSMGTTDLFCKCSKKKQVYSLVNVPQNPMGYQEPHSGTCYGGIFAFSHGNYREYLQTPLKAALEKNKTYRFSMYLSMADYSRTSLDQLGVCFLNAKGSYTTSNVITDLDPVYIQLENAIAKDVTSWHRVAVTYKAHGGEKYLLIGSFDIYKLSRTKLKVPKDIKSRINQSSERDAYYFMDDASLFETAPTEQADSMMNPEAIDRIIPDSALVMENVQFQSNEATLLPSSYPELDQLAEYLRKNAQSLVEIGGHTDNSGNEKRNKQLSEERAKTVSEYLISKGIAKERISYRGYGSTKPIAPNETEEGKQKNRRVEFIITKK